MGNEPACIELARKMRAHNRIFSFGIGTACSASLVKGLARATGGAAEFISPGERIDEKVLRTFGRLNSPVVTDATIDWDGCDVQTMAELPPVFDGVMTVFGRAPGKLPQRVTLSCRAPSSPVRWSMPVPAPADDGGVIATMWARRTIQSLEEVNDLHRQRYAGGTPSREAATLASLSKEFNLLSSLTAFVAIEHRSVEERNDGRPALRRVPVALADGWGGVRAGGILGDLRAAMCVMKRATTIDKTIDSSTVRSLDRTLDRSLERFADLNAHDTLKDLKARGDSVDLDAMDLDTLKDAADSSPIRKLVNLMLLQAIKENAGEILVEALDDCFRVTYVLNGVRRERDRMPLHIGKPVCRRLKVMACLDPIASRFPQEGAIELSVDGRLYRLEARFTPTARGRQSVALRVGRPADPAGTPAPEATAPAASASLPMHDLYAVLSTQSANGSFAPRDTVWNVLRADGLHTGGWPQEIERTAPAMAGGLLDRDAVVRTTVALLLLRRHFADQQALWRRAAGKAVTFLAHTFGCDVATVQAWLKELAARLMVAPVVPAAP